MIIATKEHTSENPDTVLLLDIDLLILATDRERFEDDDAAIRKEYAWVIDDAYTRGRGKVLQSFLDRYSIYHVPEIRGILEENARQNIKRTIASLDDSA
jgi:predicted metal-dependent HD superfamily phosphohydrolase